MKKILIYVVICFLLSTGFTPVLYGMTLLNDEMEFWGVIVVNVDQAREPYIYDALSLSENWDEDHVKLLWKEEATRQAILSSLDWLAEHADDHDIVLFAGDIHGGYIQGKLGIWPFDGSSEGIISVEELDQKFDTIQAKGMCLIFDSCHSGNFVDAMKAGFTKTRRIREQTFVKGVEGENRVVIMSSLRHGLAAHWYDELGVEGELSMTTCLAEAFAKNIDPNSDGICSAEEAFEYAKEKIFPFALRVFFNLPVQIIMFLVYGSIFKPFPNMYDPSPEELPIIIR
jgi:hypothetical protein